MVGVSILWAICSICQAASTAFLFTQKKLRKILAAALIIRPYILIIFVKYPV